MHFGVGSEDCTDYYGVMCMFALVTRTVIRPENYVEDIIVHNPEKETFRHQALSGFFLE